MATFRIHEDQENRGIPELRQKQSNMAPVQLKRAVLGTIENQPDRHNQLKGKQVGYKNDFSTGLIHPSIQPLGISKSQVGNENIKQVTQKPPPPVVPVAQFEAFKVYEDSKENEVRVHHQRSKPVVADIDLAIAKKKWFAQEAKEEQAKHEVVSKIADFDVISPPDHASPMSVERPLDETSKLVVKSKTNKDMFFENEEYRSEIYLYLREHELNNRPKPGYMRKQPDITYNMRTILVDWLVEVAEEYKLQTETLYLSINYIDRFLSYMSVVRGKLQLVGTAAMFIAAKYEEIHPPDVSEFVYITDDTYTKKQVIRMEHLILKVLSFDLSVPTPLTFITAISISTCMPEKVMYLAMYMSELTMLDADQYLDTLPSVLAAASIAIARYTLKLEPWTEELQRKTGYDTKDLRKAMEFLYLMFCKAPDQAQQAIQDKYNSSKYLHVSQLPRNGEIKLFEKI